MNQLIGVRQLYAIYTDRQAAFGEKKNNIYTYSPMILCVFINLKTFYRPSKSQFFYSMIVNHLIRCRRNLMTKIDVVCYGFYAYFIKFILIFLK